VAPARQQPRIGLLALLAVLAAALSPTQVPAQDARVPATTANEATITPPDPQTSLPDIEDEVMCPICGVTLELATEAPQAQQEREYIRDLIADGLTKEEIKDRLVAEYGPEVLAIPEDEGFDLAAWLVPAAAILAAAIAIMFGLRRWRRAGAAGDDADGEESSAEPLDPEDAKRLDADLARYEL
jgi:cytochrome c-type biogenesis protein CcmH